MSQMPITRKKVNQSSRWQSHLAPQQHELVLLLDLPLTLADCRETPGHGEGQGGLGAAGHGVTRSPRSHGHNWVSEQQQ